MSDDDDLGGGGSSGLSLPRASVQKIAKQAVPADLKIASELISLLAECCTEFVEMLFSSANGISETEKKTTITPEHVLAAIEQLELSLLKEPVTSFMQTLKESKGGNVKGRRKTGADQAGLSEADQIAMQQRMFAEARAHAAGQL